MACNYQAMTSDHHLYKDIMTSDNVSYIIFLILVLYLLHHKNQGVQFNFLNFFVLNELLNEKTMESKLINIKKITILDSFFILLFLYK